MNPEMIRKQIKNKNHNKEKDNKKTKWIRTASWVRFFLTIILTISVCIGVKKSTKFKNEFYKQVYETNISLAYINGIYKDIFGSPIPFSGLVKTPVKATFKEQLTYKKIEPYKEGAKLTVENGYLVPVKNSGLVVFIGEKDGYGQTVIIQQMDGMDLWYGNLQEINVKLYDYVEEGSLLGEVKQDTLYCAFKKDGTAIDYKEYLS